MKAKPTTKRGNRRMATDKAISKAQQAKKLIEQANGLIEEAKQEQLTIIMAAIGELRELGFTYSLSEAGKTSKAGQGSSKKAGATSKPSSGYDAAKTCQICNTTGHDGRAHRNQEPKAAFTPDELNTRGLAATA